MKTLLLLILLLLSTSIPLFGQTMVWELTLPTDATNLSFSQDGTTLTYFNQGILWIWKTNSPNVIKQVDFGTNYSNFSTVISKNNDTVYCAARVNNSIGIYVIPISKDTFFFRILSEFPLKTDGNTLRSSGYDFYIFPTSDSTKLLYCYNYSYYGSTSSYYEYGRVGEMTIDGIQTKDLGTSRIHLLNFNTNTNCFVSTGGSYFVSTRGDRQIWPYLNLTSVNTGKFNYSQPKETSSIGACSDSNYLVADGSLLHIPSKEFIRTLNQESIGTFHSCFQNFDYFISLKKDTICFVRYDLDTASEKLYCDGKINACQISNNGKRIFVLTDSKKFIVYELPNFNVIAPLHVDFKATYPSPYKGGAIQFSNNSYIPYTNYSLLWDFGDGDTSSLIHPKHTYLFPGKYTVSLTITSLFGSKQTTTKLNFIIYDDISNPSGALWAKKYSNAEITGLTFVRDSIFAGTNNGSIFSVNVNGNLGRYLLENSIVKYNFFNEYVDLSNVIHFKGFVHNDKTNYLYGIGVPKGISSKAYLYKFNLDNGLQGKGIEIGDPGFMSVRFGTRPSFYENNKDGGYATLSINSDSTHLHYSNYGSVQHYWETSVPPKQTFSGESKGNYIGTLLMKSDSIIYDNGRYPRIYADIAPNPLFLIGSENLSTVNAYSIRGGLPFNPNSYFVIAKNNVNHIRYGTFDLIAKFPTKGTILRHSPDQYYSFTSDGVWSFADGKRLDSLPLLSARSFEVFPDGVHLLVMYPKSDTVAIFNTLTKQYVQYFKANFIVSSIAISKDGKSFATGDTGGIVTLWQTPKLSITKKIEFISPQADKIHIKGDTVLFYNTSIPVNFGCRYVWDFGDGSSSQE
ncbi:MAG: PKD domain-containing protein [Ignavibacteria bacterium]|nr:PKD domain-containing protein [Ignavibacteria bacterium]